MREALMNIDPNMDKQTLSAYLGQAYQLPAAEVPLDDDNKMEAVVIKLQTAIERLLMADTKRIGPRESETAS